MGFVVRYAQRLEPGWSGSRSRRLAHIETWAAPPIDCVTVDHWRAAFRARAHSHDAVILLSIEGIEPHSLAIGGDLEFDDCPILLEPFIDQGEQPGASRSRCVDVASQPGINACLI